MMKMPPRHMLLCYGLLTWLHFFVQAQNESFTATTTAQNLLSPGYQFGLNYPDNMTYDYLIETNFLNHTLILEVTDCEMEHDKLGRCLYDTLDIYDGENASAPLIDTFCCSTAVNPTYSTSGSAAYLLFNSDATNNYKGFKIRFVSDGPTTTTSTTTTSTTTTTESTTTTTTSTTTSSTTSTTSSTTTTPTTTTSTTPVASTESATSSPDDDSGLNIWIIVGCILACIILAAVVIIAVCCWKKSKRPNSTDSENVQKRVLWSRTNTTLVRPVSPEINKSGLPPGTVVQTNIFDLDLPTSGGKANLLPPLSPPVSSVLYPPTKQPSSIDIPEVTAPKGTG